MLINRCDPPPPSYAQAMQDKRYIAQTRDQAQAYTLRGTRQRTQTYEHAQAQWSDTKAIATPACVFSEAWCVRNTAHPLRRSIAGEETSIGGDEGIDRRARSVATIAGACPPLHSLDTSIRYHFCALPVSYAALLQATQAFIAKQSAWSNVLSAQQSGKPSAIDPAVAVALLSVMRALDKQYGIWEMIIWESREPILRLRRAQLGRAGANPFIAMRRDLQVIKGQVMGKLLESVTLKDGAGTGKHAIDATSIWPAGRDAFTLREIK